VAVYHVATVDSVEELCVRRPRDKSTAAGFGSARPHSR
jgi:hypothetical protein